MLILMRVRVMVKVKVILIVMAMLMVMIMFKYLRSTCDGMSAEASGDEGSLRDIPSLFYLGFFSNVCKEPETSLFDFSLEGPHEDLHLDIGIKFKCMKIDNHDSTELLHGISLMHSILMNYLNQSILMVACVQLVVAL